MNQKLTEEQLDWCNDHLEHWKVNAQNRIDVKKGVFLAKMNFEKFPVPFGRVSGGIQGGFYCWGNKSLTTLEGAPHSLVGDFECYGCTSLTSLKGAPPVVNKFDAHMCSSLTSLEGAPQKVLGFFTVAHCKNLETLEGGPQEVTGGYQISGCEKLKNLIGLPIDARSHTIFKNILYATDCTGLSAPIRKLIEDYNASKITWEELLELSLRFFQRPNLGRAWDLGII